MQYILKNKQSYDDNSNNNNNNNNLEESYTQEKAKYKRSGWAMFTRCAFDKKENKLSFYRGKDCIEKLCKN